MKHLVIGSKGEIGIAILSILKNSVKEVYAHDLDLKHDPKIKVDIIHICFGWSDDFPFHVLDYVDKFGRKEVYVVIHSTVLPFTTKNLSKAIKNVVYSPTRGSHPNLYSDILKYTKYLASDFPEAAGLIEKIFQFAGMKTKIKEDVTDLEFSKHYSTLAFGQSLTLTQEIYAAKEAFGINPAVIMEFVNDTGKYTGDRKIYPYIEKIGGHCVVENAVIFQSFSQHAFNMVRFNKKFGLQYPEKNYQLKEEK